MLKTISQRCIHYLVQLIIALSAAKEKGRIQY
jgi:hypothetical protein